MQNHPTLRKHRASKLIKEILVVVEKIFFVLLTSIREDANTVAKGGVCDDWESWVPIDISDYVTSMARLEFLDQFSRLGVENVDRATRTSGIHKPLPCTEFWRKVAANQSL
jgi:hypothetical protein